MTGIRSAEPDTEHEVLSALRGLGDRLALWRNIRSEEASNQRELVRSEIRHVVRRGMQGGFSRSELAKPLRITPNQLDFIRKNNPSARLASDGAGASLSPGLRAHLHKLGNDLRKWRLPSRSDVAKARRADIREQIRETVEQNPQATLRDIALGLGISLQALSNIRNENTTGRPTGSSAYRKIDPQLRERLQELGSAWGNGTGTGMAEIRAGLHESFMAAIEEARETGLSLNEISDVSGISYGQVSYILHGSGAERNR